MPPPAVTTPKGGWLYDLLIKAGVSPSTAHTVEEFVVRPLEIVIVVVVAALVARYGGKVLRRLLDRLSRRAATRAGSERTASRLKTVIGLVVNLWRGFVAVVAILIILGIFGVNLTPILASATVIGATIGFGAQSLVRDYLSGVLLTLEDQFGVGDTICVNDATGTVEELTLRVTRLRAPDGSLWYVPNGEIRKLSNRSRGWAKAVVDVTFTPTDPGSLDRAKGIAGEAAGRAASDPRFGLRQGEEPQVIGVIAADATTCTLQVTARTRPTWREPLERAIRQEVIQDLLSAGLWTPSAGDSS